MLTVIRREGLTLSGTVKIPADNRMAGRDNVEEKGGSRYAISTYRERACADQNRKSSWVRSADTTPLMVIVLAPSVITALPPTSER